ncbi:MAG: phosphopantetheine-binding protein [Flavobacteriaceae bacterium]|nr:phosphopantetheine-binding protein [Flavobacteriaceae bacterium]
MENDFIEILKDVFEVDEIGFGDRFRDYDSWSSLTNIALIAMLDDEYDIIIDDKEFRGIETVEELFNEIKIRTA